MQSTPPPNSASVMRQFPYRYPIKYAIFLVLVGLIPAVAFAVAASSNGKAVDWLCVVLFALISAMGCVALFASLRGKSHVFVTADDIYIPSIWKRDTFTRIAFSKITRMRVVTFKGSVSLLLVVGKKERLIPQLSFTQKGDFRELVELVQQRVQSSSS